jgi:hypothetical protein
VLVVVGAGVAGWLVVAAASMDDGSRSDSARKVAMLSMLGWSKACSTVTPAARHSFRRLLHWRKHPHMTLQVCGSASRI